MTSDRTLVAIVGPTASGKSYLAVHLALRFGGEIVNCDSLQLYRRFDIGTGKLTPAEQQGVPHHLIGVLDPEEISTAGEYMRAARQAILSVESRGRLPIVVGGTGFYLRALVEGLFAGPGRSPEIRERLQRSVDRKDPAYLHRLLHRLDPIAAAEIHAHDQPKIIRAIEVCLQAKRPISALFDEGKVPIAGYRILKLGLAPPRTALYDRINRRTRSMFLSGLVEEVEEILRQGVPLTAPPFQSHGYREAAAILKDGLSLDEAVQLTQTQTRQYAKRQMTWFRNEAGIHWMSGFGTDPDLQSLSEVFLVDRQTPRIQNFAE